MRMKKHLGPRGTTTLISVQGISQGERKHAYMNTHQMRLGVLTYATAGARLIAAFNAALYKSRYAPTIASGLKVSA
jgi:hypothetical protein